MEQRKNKLNQELSILEKGIIHAEKSNVELLSGKIKDKDYISNSISRNNVYIDTTSKKIEDVKQKIEDLKKGSEKHESKEVKKEVKKNTKNSKNRMEYRKNTNVFAILIYLNIFNKI